jgi:ferredoxin
MPNNFFPRKIIFKKNEKKVCRVLEAAKRYAEDILNGKSKWGRIPVLSDMMAMISQSEWSWNLCRKWKWYSLKIDTSKCNKCGLCVELCPVNNIMMNENPEFGSKCNICMRCISFCQTEAIYLPKKKYKLYRAVKVDELLKDG